MVSKLFCDLGEFNFLGVYTHEFQQLSIMPLHLLLDKSYVGILIFGVIYFDIVDFKTTGNDIEYPSNTSSSTAFDSTSQGVMGIVGSVSGFDMTTVRSYINGVTNSLAGKFTQIPVGVTKP
jgi:hypothetical protein